MRVIDTLKKQLRTEFLQKIAALDPEYIKTSNAKIFQALTALPVFKQAKNVFTYVSVKNEIDTLRLIEHCFEQGKNVAVPVCHPGYVLKPHIITALDQLKPAKMKLLEPDANSPVMCDTDICIIPALSVDENLVRLGYGGGYYDRFLPGFQGAKIGLCRKQLLSKLLPNCPYDVKLDIVITD